MFTLGQFFDVKKSFKDIAVFGIIVDANYEMVKII